jgi:hypothetical protein
MLLLKNLEGGVLENSVPIVPTGFFFNTSKVLPWHTNCARHVPIVPENRTRPPAAG